MYQAVIFVVRANYQVAGIIIFPVFISVVNDRARRQRVAQSLFCYLPMLRSLVKNPIPGTLVYAGAATRNSFYHQWIAVKFPSFVMRVAKALRVMRQSTSVDSAHEMSAPAHSKSRST
jgi:hypothetical protein